MIKLCATQCMISSTVSTNARQLHATGTERDCSVMSLRSPQLTDSGMCTSWDLLGPAWGLLGPIRTYLIIGRSMDGGWD
jgi:hypothetical protein